MSSSPRVLHLCYADNRGGAAIGARRLHQSMLGQGVDSKLLVIHKFTKDDRVLPIPKSKWWRGFIHHFNVKLKTLIRSENPVYRSINLLPTGADKFINSLDADIVQMHWVGADTISIGEIGKLNKPVVWKLPDMWAFSGCTHYGLPDDPPRYRDGYSRANRPGYESGFDLDKWVWRYKRFAWRKANLSIVGPSSWIARLAKESVLFRQRRVRHILNPLDLDLYKPLEKTEVRAEFGLPTDKTVVMFGAMHATQDTRKGFHHLKAALAKLPEFASPDQVVFAVLGSEGESGEKIAGFDVHYLGIINDEERIVRAYNTADVFVLPAEMDNLPNVVKEATCCGVPCVGFDIGGMPDMVHHGETGYLAQPFDSDELAKGVAWAIDRCGPELRDSVRARAVEKHEPARAVAQYLDFYEEILSSKGEQGH